MIAEDTPFDVLGPLPTGTTVLEASAGTGKTYAVGALVTRYVAEGVARLEEMLVITFGRAASQELRDRVRAQLVRAERALSRPDEADRGEALIAHLLDADAAELAGRHERVADALASFDAATIATTHQFCQLVLRSLGVAGDTDNRAELVDNLRDLTDEVVDDLYLQFFATSPDEPPFDRTSAGQIARHVVEDPHAVPMPETGGSDVMTQRADFARAVLAEIDRRKRRLGLLSYDDLLSRLADALEPEHSPARDRMRARWSVVLVDEFQDTDPVQWQVLDRAFSGHATMVLIGDPKQAIYAFRGGDIDAYLAAAETAGTHQSMSVNWRSDAPLVEALGALWTDLPLGDERIVVHPVTAHHQGSRLVGAPQPQPLRVREVVPSSSGSVRRGSRSASCAK